MAVVLLLCLMSTRAGSDPPQSNVVRNTECGLRAIATCLHLLGTHIDHKEFFGTAGNLCLENADTRRLLWFVTEADDC